ncbi:hypothetical protein [Nocardia brasiliensis]|uniref:hypothetical protein n=1 Tax=Nocardia brasiliensis TaxID=37326 RepID=UPI0009DED767|nr:hypothetical protein [Nocardia brasiliensis]
MAGKVFFSVSMSLDGFIAPESPAELMGQQWKELHQRSERGNRLAPALGAGRTVELRSAGSPTGGSPGWRRSA